MIRNLIRMFAYYLGRPEQPPGGQLVPANITIYEGRPKPAARAAAK